MEQLILITADDLHELVRQFVASGVKATLEERKLSNILSIHRHIFYTIEDLVELWGKSASAIITELKAHGIKPLKHKHCNYYAEEDLDKCCLAPSKRF